MVFDRGKEVPFYSWESFFDGLFVSLFTFQVTENQRFIKIFNTKWDSMKPFSMEAEELRVKNK